MSKEFFRACKSGLDVCAVLLMAFFIASCGDPLKEGNDLMAKGDYKGAAEFYQAKLKKRPNDARLHNEYGMALKKLNRNREAQSQYKEAVRLKPDYPEAHYNLGTLLMLETDYAGAIGELSKAIEQNPNYAKAYNNRGLANFYSGAFNDAVRDFEEAIRLDPSDPLFKDNLERAKAGKKEFQEKMDAFLEEADTVQPE